MNTVLDQVNEAFSAEDQTLTIKKVDDSANLAAEISKL